MYLIISLLVLGVSFYLFKKASGSMAITRINIISNIFYRDLFVLSFIGSVLIVYYLDDNFVLNLIGNDYVRLYGWLAVLYTMVMMPIGMILVTKLFKIKSMEGLFKRYLNSPCEESNDIRLPLYFLTLVSLVATIYTYSQLEYIPLMGFLKEDMPLWLAQQRAIASFSMEGRMSHIREILGIALTPVLCYTAYVYWRMTKKPRDLLWFLTLFVTTMLILTYNLAKAPVLCFFLGFLLLRVLMTGRIKKRDVFVAFVLVTVLSGVMYFYIVGEGNIDSLLLTHNLGIAGRILTGEIGGLFASLYIYPDVHPFIGFRSILPKILNPEPIQLSYRTLIEIFLPQGVRLGTSGSMNSLFIADAWADFGLIGLMLAPFLAGVLVQTLNVLLLKTKKIPLILGIFSYLSFGLPTMGTFSDFILNRRLLGLFLVLFLAIYFPSKLKSKTTVPQRHLAPNL